MPEQAAQIGQRPAFVERLVGASDEDRAKALSSRHKNYDENLASWQVLVDAFEGRGGFLDGSYLWQYPREDSAQFDERKKQARYHNFFETLVDLYVRFIFTQGVKRESKSTAYNEWLQDVDGAGTGVNEFLKRFAAMALVCGHAGMLVDKTQDEPEGPTKAEERARTFASIFPATSILDWRFTNTGLTAVKLQEAPPPPPIDQLPDPDADEASPHLLLWDVEGWGRFGADGALKGAGVPGLDMVPFVILRPKPSHLSLMLGRPLVSNANVIRAMFNRASEEDEVLRAQAFSVLVVSVDAEANVDEVKQQLGGMVGAAKAIVVKGDADYKTPDMSVPGAIRDNIAYLTQEMYRAAHVRFRRDSLAAESGDAIRLQYAELNEMLQALSRSLSQAEEQMARAWFAWNATTPEQAQAEFEEAQPVATYPDEFFLDALINDLDAWARALELGLGPTMARRIKKRAARRVDPDMAPEEMAEVDDEIDAMDDDEAQNKEQPPALAPGADTGDPEADLMRARETDGDEEPAG